MGPTFVTTRRPTHQQGHHPGGANIRADSRGQIRRPHSRDHWTVEAGHHIRDVTFTEDHATSRTRHGPINLATIRNTVINAIRDAGYLHIPEGRRDHTTPTEALHLHRLIS